MKQIKWSRPSRRKDGHLGARMRLAVTREGGCDGHYSFDSHGMTSTQAAEKIASIEAFHEARAARMSAFRAMQSSEFVVGVEVYRIVDLTVRYPEDASSCALYIDVRRIEGKKKETVAGFPKLLRYGHPSDIPSDEELLSFVRAGLPDIQAIADAHAEFTSKVAMRLEGRG
jgi:hypothetical protein